MRQMPLMSLVRASHPITSASATASGFASFGGSALNSGNIG
jgi:hypothetical protein